MGSRSSSPSASEPAFAKSRWAACALSCAALLAAPGARCDEEATTCIAKHEEAQVAQREGRLKAAREALLSCTRSSCPTMVRADCATWLSDLIPLIPSVVFSVQSKNGDEEAVRVSMDGHFLTATLNGQSIDVDPGVHVFQFELPPNAPVQKKVIIREGEKNRMILADFTPREELAQPKPAPIAPRKPEVEMHRPVPLVVYVLGGATVIGAGLFAGFTVSGNASRQSLLENCAPFCDEREVQSVRTKFLVADISLATAASAAIAAGVVFLLRPTVPQQVTLPQRASIWVAPAASGTLTGFECAF